MATKDEVRRGVWERMREGGAARFPFPIVGRIPNFKGAEAAAERLAGTDAWKRAKVLKCNPDSPQRPVRQRALDEGKTIYMAVPRLTELECFIEIDPAGMDAAARRKASTIAGAADHGEPVPIDALRPVDLIVAGSVGVRRDGARAGKGGGYSDLEYALAKTLGLVGDDRTTIATTVHPLQLTDDRWELRPHDIPVDLIVTPDETIETRTKHPRPEGVYWDLLKPEMRAKIPVLEQFAKDS